MRLLPEVLVGVAVCALLDDLRKRVSSHGRRRKPATGLATKQDGGAAAASSPAAVASLALEGGAPLVDLGLLDCSCPQRFYLPDLSLEKLADCFASVGGVRLPLHNQLLAAHAAVLRQVFVATAEDSNNAAPSSQAPVDLSSAFSACTVTQVAAFLRFIYSPDHATPASLAAVHRHEEGLLAAVAELAHRLDARGLLAKIEAYLQGASASASISELLGAVLLAETCHLSALADTCLTLLARQLAAAGPFWHEQVSPRQLAGCNSESLASLACKMAAIVAAGPFEPPEVHHVQRGLEGRAGGFTWVIKHFSKQQGRVTSPWVEVGGVEWRLKVWPRGDDAAGNTHLSAYLECNLAQAQTAGQAAVNAQYEFLFLDQSEEGLHYCVDCGSDAFTPTTQNWGKTRMMPLEELGRADRSYLANDRLAVRISIRVLPRGGSAAPAAVAVEEAAAA